MSWILLIVLVAGCYALKALGVTTLGSVIETKLGPVVVLLPPALFTALIVVQTFDEGGALVVDARLAGVAAALTTWRKAPLIVVVVVAMGVTAGLRALL